MPNIDLLTIRMSSLDIRRIEDEAIALFRTHSKAGPIDADNWLLQYMPIIVEDGQEEQYDLVAEKLLESGSWILQVLQCYRRAVRLAMLYTMKAALLGKESADPDEVGIISEGMKQIKLQPAQTQRENEFLEVFLAYCKKHHRPHVGIPVTADGVEAYLLPKSRNSAPQSVGAAQKQPTNSVYFSDMHQVSNSKEKELFDNYYAKIQQNLIENPMDIGVSSTDFDFDLSPYVQHFNQYTQRIAAQEKQKKETKWLKTAQWLAKERKAKTTFHLIAWIFFMLAVAAKLLLVLIEPITVFTFVPIVGIDILYGLVVGWVGKITNRVRGLSTGLAWIEAILSVIAMGIAASIVENDLVLWVQLGACWIPWIAALITRGKR